MVAYYKEIYVRENIFREETALCFFRSITGDEQIILPYRGNGKQTEFVCITDFQWFCHSD